MHWSLPDDPIRNLNTHQVKIRVKFSVDSGSDHTQPVTPGRTATDSSSIVDSVVSGRAIWNES